MSSFSKGLKQWLTEKEIDHDLSHVRALDLAKLAKPEKELGTALARKLKSRKAIMGVFDEGCMGMYNAIIPDELLHPTGVYKERLSQSALFAGMQAGYRCGGAGGSCDWLDQERHEVRNRPERRDRSDRQPDPAAVQDVYRRPADRRRVRLRRDRHPVSAGFEGPGCRHPIWSKAC